MSAVPADLRIASPWRTALPPFLLLVAAILLLYRDTAMTMVGIWWRSETFAHAFLVLPISLWLVWRRRGELAALTPRAEPWVLLPLLAAAVVWLLARLVVADVVSQFAFVAMLVLAVPAVLGIEVAMVILFPLLFLFFGVPFGEFVVPTMMAWTADFVVSALQATGVPVFREGQHFIIPTGSWSVIDECSGVRYLMASFMVGTLFAYLNYRSYRRRAVFMAVALLVPVLANWFRAYLIVMLAYLSGNKIATGIDHIIYGWVFFGFIIFLMFIIGARWSEPDEVRTEAAVGAGAPMTPAQQSALTRSMLLTLVFGAAIALLPHGVAGLLLRAEDAAAAPRVELPAELAGGWTTQGAALVAYTPKWTGPSIEVARAYKGAAGTVGLDVAYYRGQGEGHKLVSYTNQLVAMRHDEWNLLPGGGLRDVELGTRTLTVQASELSAGRDPDDSAPAAPGRLALLLGRWPLHWQRCRRQAGRRPGPPARSWRRGGTDPALRQRRDGRRLERRAGGVPAGQRRTPERLAAADPRRALRRPIIEPRKECQP